MRKKVGRAIKKVARTIPGTIGKVISTSIDVGEILAPYMLNVAKTIGIPLAAASLGTYIAGPEGAKLASGVASMLIEEAVDLGHYAYGKMRSKEHWPIKKHIAEDARNADKDFDQIDFMENDMPDTLFEESFHRPIVVLPVADKLTNMRTSKPGTKRKKNESFTHGRRYTKIHATERDNDDISL